MDRMTSGRARSITGSNLMPSDDDKPRRI